MSRKNSCLKLKLPIIYNAFPYVINSAIYKAIVGVLDRKQSFLFAQEAYAAHNYPLACLFLWQV